MADVSNIGARTRVALLARAGKAADNLADAVRQAGAELLVTVDPAATDEAALRALDPQALLIALEPSIEAALDSFDDILVDPSIIVIFDEADVAAHRSGWDAQRWVRHLSAKLRRDSNVLPPGAENDADWQPSPGKVPAPSAAYANVDMTSFTREAVAHADSVPADGMPADGVPAYTAPANTAPAAVGQVAVDPIALDAGLLDAIPAAAAPAAPAVTVPAAMPFEVEAPAPAASNDNPRVSFGALELDAIEIDAVELDGVDIDVVDIESASLETVSLDAVDLGGFDDTPAADAPLSLDVFSFEDAPAATPAASGLQLDDDAFFAETLSNDRVAQGEPLPEIRFDDFDPAAMDFESVQTPAPKRDPETVLSFEELIAKSMAAAGEVPVSDPVGPAPGVPTLPPPLPAFDAQPVPATPAAPSFSLGELSLAPVEDAPMAAPVASDKPDRKSVV